MHVPPSDVEPVPGVLTGLVVDPAEEQRRVRQVAERLDAPVQVGLEVLLGYRVAAQRAEGQHVLAHQPEELPGLGQVRPLGRQHRVSQQRVSWHRVS